jgi:hypothetical protein
MVDIGLSVVVTRDNLGLPDLQLNDHASYYASADQFLGTAAAWNRNQVASPFIDGSVTVSRQLGMVVEALGIEVLGDSPVDAQNKMAVLAQAFMQSDFQLGVQVGGAIWQWQCEAADVTRAWTTPRMAANQWLMTFSVPRQPNAIAGVF